MRWLRGLLLAASIGPLASACSSGTPESSGSEAPSGSVVQAITAACSFDTIGLPCDPDGPAGAKLECEGVCTIAISGLVACQAVAAGALNGVTCGTSAGVGDAACKRYCSGRTCLVADAPAGTACRPNAKSNPCEGQCDGAGKCDNVPNACDFGRDGQLCKFATCNFSNATACITKNLAHNTICSDNDACTIGKCGVTGLCVKGPTVGCNDGNPCTDDSCDPNNGGCLGVNNDNNACSDGNACLTGEHCSAGSCVAGTVPVDCDDSNECTVDSCDPNVGCAHVKKSCSDGDACTADVCAPVDGSCSHPAVTCDDNDPCTDNSCDSGSGCVFSPKNCDDNDACTADACSAGSCTHDAISCDDKDDCTADSCAANTGCLHDVIAGCGAGGADAGGAGGTSSGGTGGTDAAGTSTGGTSEPMAGAAGDAAAGSPSGGTTGAAGEGNMNDAGQPGVSGTTGNGGSNATAGSGGSVGGDVATAGTTTTAGTSTSGGGTTSNGGASSGGDTTNAGTNGAPTSGDDGGCGCRTVGTPSRTPEGTIVFALLGLTAFWRRRRNAA